MKIFITGISSFLGAHLARSLKAAGHEVHGSARLAEPSQGIRSYILGATPPSDLFEACSVVIHCAWDIKNPETTNNIAATQLLSEAARTQGVSRQIFISSLSARADAPTRYGADKFKAESLFDLSANDIIVRPGLIVGPGGLFRQTYEYLRDHRFIPLIDGGHFPMPLVGIQELAECIEKLLPPSRPAQRPLRLFHTHIPSQRDCFKDIIKLKSWNKTLVWLPSAALIPGLALMEFVKLRLPITRSNVVAALKNRFSPEESDLHFVLGREANYMTLIKSVSAFQ